MTWSHLHLQQMDYLTYIDIYHARIKAFHVKDAEFRRNGRNGVYGGYQPLAAGRAFPLSRRRTDRLQRGVQ